MENLILLLISIIIILAKFLNCYLLDLNQPTAKFNWPSLLITIFIVNLIFYTFFIVGYSLFPFGLLYVIGGFFYTAINLARALENYTGKNNRITRIFR